MGEKRIANGGSFKAGWFVASAAAAYWGYRTLRARTTDFRGKVVLITGGSRGLGQMLARAFAEEGCKIAICARDAIDLERARLNLAERGAEVLAVPCDVSIRGDIDRVIDETIVRFGSLDVLVNNAGVIQVGPVDRMTIEDFEHAMATNFWGSLYSTLAAVPHMRAQGGGNIVNITSIGGKIAMPHLLPYDCAKFAALGLSEGMRAELAKDRIRVTTVVPGLMRTGSWINVAYKGRPEEEFAWFSAAASQRGVSIDVRRAARRIVEATKLGQAELVLGWQAKLARLGNDLFPGLATMILAEINRRLPPGANVGPSDAFGREVVDARRMEEIGAPVASSREGVAASK